MENKEHIENLKEIRSIMEQSSKFITLSGLSGVFIGIYAIIGSAIAYIKFNYNIFEPAFSYRPGKSFDDSNNIIQFIFTDAALVLFLAIATAVILTLRKAKKAGVKTWNSAARKMLVNLIIPLLAGGIFCMALLYHGILYLIAPTTLIFYGLALLNAGKFTLHDIRYLGVFEILLGLISAFIPEYGLIFWSIGFGIMHIIYGIIM
ncbi:MAG: hypothetical protein C0594_15575 [Marinilabiliales bacterium]|nr:MAG: hypothetical protein C0594_15575 [Marinilabiliales bacterium]